MTCNHTVTLTSNRARKRWANACPVCWVETVEIKLLITRRAEVTGTAAGMTEISWYPAARVDVAPRSALGHHTDPAHLAQATQQAQALLDAFGLDPIADLDSADTHQQLRTLREQLAALGNVTIGGKYSTRIAWERAA